MGGATGRWDSAGAAGLLNRADVAELLGPVDVAGLLGPVDVAGLLGPVDAAGLLNCVGAAERGAAAAWECWAFTGCKFLTRIRSVNDAVQPVSGVAQSGNDVSVLVQAFVECG